MGFDTEHQAISQRSTDARQRLANALLLMCKGAARTAEERAEVAAAQLECKEATRALSRLNQDLKKASKKSAA